jgi:hypothetical protein
VSTFFEGWTGAAGATAGVVVIRERLYAEGNGDRADLGTGMEGLDAIDKMKAAGIPMVAILFSSRPMIVGELLEIADALVAARLPGTRAKAPPTCSSATMNRWENCPRRGLVLWRKLPRVRRQQLRSAVPVQIRSRLRQRKCARRSPWRGRRNRTSSASVSEG